jgi:predicted TIM-barrel fold metal-dependent hydrolase
MDTQLGKDRKIEEIGIYSDTRDILAHARHEAEKAGIDDWFIVDVDAHHMESISWAEIVQRIEDPVIRDQAVRFQKERVGAPPYGINADLGLRYQDVGGRIPHQLDMREAVEDKSVHRDVTLTRRAIDSLCLDYIVVFPTPMLQLGMHPQIDMEVTLGRAYTRWLVETILPADKRIKSFAYLPFNSPQAAIKMVEDFGDCEGIIGFCVTSARYKPVHHNDYMRLYAMLEERGLPIAFHAGYHWNDPSLATINRFLGMHALGFVWCNMVHMTNWILNGIPVRFPKLKSVWVESGLAWVPFLQQRLDEQYLMRTSEAPLLTRLPSDYMRENCWYSSQPMERTNMKATALTFEMINAETQLLYSSDWPHFDFDTPGIIADMHFLSEQAKRNILGLNAANIFGLEVPSEARS